MTKNYAAKDSLLDVSFILVSFWDYTEHTLIYINIQCVFCVISVMNGQRMRCPSLVSDCDSAVRRRRDVIIIGSPDIYHCNYYYCYLLLMIVYVGIVRASLLINIVRFDLARLHLPPELPSTPSAPWPSATHNPLARSAIAAWSWENAHGPG